MPDEKPNYGPPPVYAQAPVAAAPVAAAPAAVAAPGNNPAKLFLDSSLLI